MKIAKLILSGVIAFQTLSASAGTPYFRFPVPKEFFGDTTKKAPANWFNLDAAANGINGVSTEKTYEFLKGKPSKTIVVAVIDSGVDIEHEDLKDKIWKNEKEIPNNGIDDDKNGYIDDQNGWSFLGGKDGRNVQQDSYEVTRLYAKLKKRFDGKSDTDIAAADKTAYELYKKTKEIYSTKKQSLASQLMNVKGFQSQYLAADRLLKAYTDEEKLTADIVKAIESTDKKIQQMQQIWLYADQIGFDEQQIKEYIDYCENGINYGYNLDFDPRNIIGDNYNDVSERNYGNNDVKGPDSKHGTHVSGIIAANRNNNLGMKGIAENVQIMAIRAVPDGDERDKDIANAIYYAVNNGARVINMSFGKAFSPDKTAIDAAMKYAESKGVLLVHAAGNDAKNLDVEVSYPSRTLLDGKTQVKTWIEVGASSWGKDAGDFIGNFSNYGKKSVDLFAPGVDIYSTTPEQKYENQQGTSMAAPVVAGVAALILSYYPELSADQVKEILVKSTVKHVKDVKKPKDSGDEEGEDKPSNVKFSELSITGGIVNAFEALKMAEIMSKKIRKR